MAAVICAQYSVVSYSIRDELTKRNISKGREYQHPSENALVREDFKYIAHVHSVREERKRLL